jgi:hypothetical protein
MHKEIENEEDIFYNWTAFAIGLQHINRGTTFHAFHT